MLGKVLSKKERVEASKEFNKISNNKEVSRTVKVKIKKDSYLGYVARDKSGTMYPIKKVISNPKARQEYVLELNPYEKVIGCIKI